MKDINVDEFIEGLKKFFEQYEAEYEDAEFKVLEEEDVQKMDDEEVLEASKTKGRSRIKTVKEFIPKLWSKIKEERFAKRTEKIVDCIHQIESINEDYLLELQKTAGKDDDFDRILTLREMEKIEKNSKKVIQLLGASPKEAEKNGYSLAVYNQLNYRLTKACNIMDVQNLMDKAWNLYDEAVYAEEQKKEAEAKKAAEKTEDTLENEEDFDEAENFDEEDLKPEKIDGDFTLEDFKLALNKTKSLTPNSFLQKRNLKELKEIATLYKFQIPEEEFLTEHELEVKKMSKEKNDLIKKYDATIEKILNQIEQDEEKLNHLQSENQNLREQNLNATQKIADLEKENEELKKELQNKKENSDAMTIEESIKKDLREITAKFVALGTSTNKEDAPALQQYIEDCLQKYEGKSEFAKYKGNFVRYQSYVEKILSSTKQAPEPENPIKEAYQRQYEHCLAFIKDRDKFFTEYEKYVKANLFVKTYDECIKQNSTKEEFEEKYQKSVAISEKNFMQEKAPAIRVAQIAQLPTEEMEKDEAYKNIKEAVKKAQETQTAKDMNIAKGMLDSYTGKLETDSLAKTLNAVDVKTSGYTEQEISQNYLEHIDSQLNQARTPEELNNIITILNNNQSFITPQEYNSRMQLIQNYMNDWYMMNPPDLPNPEEVKKR